MSQAKKRSKNKTSEQQDNSTSRQDEVINESTRTATPEERHYLIAVAAYFIAEQRGFQGDAALDDWVQAEAAVDANWLKPG